MLRDNNVIGYIRVSTDEQQEGFSLPEQTARIENYCSAMGLNLVKVFTDTQTGSTINREGINQMKEYLNTGLPIKSLVVYKLDRLSRNLKNLLVFMEDELIPRNISLVSITEQFDSGSPIGKFFIQMLGSFSEYERNLIKERTHMGVMAKKEAGGYYGGVPSYCYQTDNAGNLSINHDEVITATLIWKRHKAGRSLSQIAEYLNCKGIKPRRGDKWFPQSIKNTLKIITAKGVELGIKQIKINK
jgi:DNA invertase Pin-like site-specific DNA recombinase